MKQHKISLVTAILMNINIMVGSGILIGPAVMAGVAGNASFLALASCCPLVFTYCIELVQLSRMCPRCGRLLCLCQGRIE